MTRLAACALLFNFGIAAAVEPDPAKLRPSSEQVAKAEALARKLGSDLFRVTWSSNGYIPFERKIILRQQVVGKQLLRFRQYAFDRGYKCFSPALFRCNTREHISSERRRHCENQRVAFLHNMGKITRWQNTVRRKCYGGEIMRIMVTGSEV